MLRKYFETIVEKVYRKAMERYRLPPALAKYYETESRDAWSVLFMGNSLTYENHLPYVVAELSKPLLDRRPLKVFMVCQAGYTLDNHLTSGLSLEILNFAGPWQYVVLQEQSNRSADEFEKAQASARLLTQAIKKVGAVPVVYSIWSHQADLNVIARLSSNFARLSDELDAINVQAGDQWKRAIEDGRLQLYADSIHPTPVGTYLTACCFVKALFGDLPKELPSRVVLNGTAIIELTEEELTAIKDVTSRS